MYNDNALAASSGEVAARDAKLSNEFWAAPDSGGTKRDGQQIPLLLQYWRIAFRWKWLIAGILIASFVVGLIVTLFMTPLYTATASMEISRQADKIVNVQGVEPDVSTVDMEFYQTQYSLLRARSLAERVARDLKLAETDDFFESFGVRPDDSGIFAKLAARRPTPEQKQKRLKKAVDLLLDNASISPVRGSSLVDVSFTSPNAALSQRIVNAWTNGFISSNLDRRYEASSYARKFLEDRLQQLRVRLEESERQVVQYATTQKIISIASAQDSGAGERSLMSDDLARLNGALADAVADRVRAESRLNDRGSVSSEALSNAAITSLRQKRAEVASEYANLLTRFEPAYPAARALASQVSALDSSIAREEDRVRQGLSTGYRDAVAREQVLRLRMEGLKGSALDLRRRSIQYNIYQREADTNRQLYDALLQRYKEIGIAGGVGTNNVLIVDPAALPTRPSSPRMIFNLLIVLVIGSAVAAAAVFALEQVDETVKDPSEISRALEMPALGTIPKADGGDPRLVLADRKSPLTESYLSVQTNLRFSTDHGIPRSLAVTSTRAGEGKSTTSFALTQTFGRIGKKVILVDCDLRSPSVHYLLDVANVSGVSNFLSGHENIEELIVSVDGMGFDCLLAGPQPPNAAELLNSARLQTLIERLLTIYDHVVVDSPPVLGLADAPLICSQVEGVIYVVEANGSRSSMIRAALSRLRSANVTLLGVVLTKFDAAKAHYGYGYEYGYGYGQKNAIKLT